MSKPESPLSTTLRKAWPDEPAERLQRLWQQGRAPDVHAFLTQAGELSPAEFVDVLHVDQQCRRQAGEVVLAEAYLERYPTLRADADRALDLVYGEFLLREELGEQPTLEEYAQRFPDYAEVLRAQVGLHRALPMDFGSDRDAEQAGSEAKTYPTVSGYEILGELGRGGMGVVYQARQTGLDRLVALKMILGGSHAGPEELARFRTEAEAVARFQHPNIVQIYEVGNQDGLPYFSLEFCAGGSLAAHLAGTPRPSHQAARLVETLARAMHAAHGQGIVHRDLKPANVLLAADGTPKITDFGLAKKLDGGAGQTASGAVVGTPSYMAPEQAGGKTKDIGPGTDVYALGAVLYELLTGRPPFRAETPMDTVLQVLREERVPVRRLEPKVPPDLETICHKCLHKELSRRYATAEELADDLHRFLNGEPIRARPVGRAERVWRWCRRNPAVATLAAAVVLALVMGTGVAWYFAIQAGDEARQALLQKQQAEDNAQLARQEQERTQKSLQFARQALEQMTSFVLEDLLDRQPELTDEHREYLRQALALYDKFAQETGLDEVTCHGVALAHWRVGNLRLRLGEYKEAEAAYHRALALQEQLATDFPGQPLYRLEWAFTINNLGAFLLKVGQAAEAEAPFLQSRDLRAKLVTDFPEVPRYRRDLAINHYNLARVWQKLNRQAEAAAAYRQAADMQEKLAKEFPAEPKYRHEWAESLMYLARMLGETRFDDALAPLSRALDLQKQLAADFPKVPEYRSEWARSLSVLGNLLGVSRQLDKAEPALRQAVEILKELVADFPGRRPYAIQLGDTCWNLGHVLRLRGRTEDALESFTRAVQILEPIHARDPHTARSELRKAYWGRAGALVDLKRYPGALADYDRTLALADKSNRTTLGANRALVLVRLKDHTGAAAAVEELSRAPDARGEIAFRMAVVLGSAASVVRDDANLSEEERRRQSELYVNRALELLRRAIETGYKDVGALKKSRNLDPLRSRAEFKDLLLKLEKPPG